jgi:hypothetical protein
MKKKTPKLTRKGLEAMGYPWLVNTVMRQARLLRDKTSTIKQQAERSREQRPLSDLEAQNDKLEDQNNKFLATIKGYQLLNIDGMQAELETSQQKLDISYEKYWAQNKELEVLRKAFDLLDRVAP